MPTMRIIGVLLLVCGSVLGVSAQAVSKQVLKEIEKGYTRIGKGWKEHNVATITSVWSPDYTALSSKWRTLSRSLAEREVSRFVKLWKYSVDMRFTIETSKVVQEGKSVELRVSQKGILAIGADAKAGNNRYEAPFFHTWVKTKRGWRLQYERPVPFTPVRNKGVRIKEPF